MTRGGNILTYSIYFIAFLAIQVILFMHFSLFAGMAFCYFYILFILMLPIQLSHVMLMLVAFFTGLSVDLFYSTQGIHAAVSVLVAYMRPYLINLLTPRGGYDESVELSISSLGSRWFVTYASILIFVHHFTLFIIESIGFGNVLLLLGKTIASSIFTLVMVILAQYLIYTPKRA